MWCESLERPQLLGIGPSASAALAAYRRLRQLLDGVRCIRRLHAAVMHSQGPLQVGGADASTSRPPALPSCTTPSGAPLPNPTCHGPPPSGSPGL